MEAWKKRRDVGFFISLGFASLREISASRPRFNLKAWGMALLAIGAGLDEGCELPLNQPL
jgi:hypothetical protein